MKMLLVNAASVKVCLLAGMWVLGVSTVAAESQDAPKDSATGSISGYLIDRSDVEKSAANVIVFVVDAKTGFPLLQDSQEILSLGKHGNIEKGLAGFRHAVTSETGSFLLKDVPVGEWRLVAQEWIGADHVPDRKEDDRALQLHGAIERVIVRSNEVTEVRIRPLGDKSVLLENQPAEANTYLFLSMKAPFGEPIFGPLAWGDEFRANIIGVTHQRMPSLIVHGLPDTEVSVSLLNYDNNPGIGGLSFIPGKSLKQTIPIYASWSNGYFTPPERLLPLVDYFDKTPGGFESIMDAHKELFPFDARKPNAIQQIYGKLETMKNKAIEAPGLGEWQVLDVLAARSYGELRKYHLERQKANSKQ